MHSPQCTYARAYMGDEMANTQSLYKKIHTVDRSCTEFTLIFIRSRGKERDDRRRLYIIILCTDILYAAQSWSMTVAVVVEAASCVHVSVVTNNAAA